MILGTKVVEDPLVLTLRARSDADLDIDPVAVMQVLIRSRSIIVGHNDDSALKTWSEEYTSLAASMNSLRE